MAIRVTPAAVKELRGTDVDVAPMIAAASLIVDDLNTECGTSFDEARLTQIELWLAAHFVGTLDPVISREKFENAENTYQVGSSALSGVMSDKYGQTANMLAGGCLVDFDKAVANVDFIT